MTFSRRLPHGPLADEDQEDEEAAHHVQAADAAKQNLKKKLRDLVSMMLG